jgi:hypothetical protein
MSRSWTASNEIRRINVSHLSWTRREIRESNTIEHKKRDKRNNVLKQIFFENEILLKWSMCWNRSDDETQKTRMNSDAFEKNLTKLFASLEREKEDHQSKEKDEISSSLSHHLWLVVESLTSRSLSEIEESSIKRDFQNIWFNAQK